MQSFLGIDELKRGQLQSFDELKRGQEKLQRTQEYLVREGLRYTDAPEIATVANANRCFFIPSTTIKKICCDNSSDSLLFFEEVLGMLTPSTLQEYTS